MNNFEPSGENAAALTPEMGSCVTAPVVRLKIFTRLKLAVVLETTTRLPSGETAKTLPTTALAVPASVLFAGVKTINPSPLPR